MTDDTDETPSAPVAPVAPAAVVPAAPVVKNLKPLQDLLSVAVQVANAVVAAPKPITLASLELLLPLLPQIEALSTEVSQIPTSLKELDAGDAENILTGLQQSLNLGATKAEAVALAGLKVCADLVGLLQAINA